MVTRRNFLKAGAAMIALGALPGGFSCTAFKKQKQIGVQLYSVRDELKNDFDGTMKALADIGYKRFESYGYRDGKYFGKTPKEMKQYMNDLGGVMTGSHTGSGLLDENDEQAWDFWRKNVDDTAELGCKWIVQAGYPVKQLQTVSDIKRFAEQFNRIGEMAKNNGLKFAFHNHVEEFHGIEGRIPYEVLIEQTDPNLVFFQIDTAQMVYGGFDPVKDYINSYPGRFSNWHLKDANPDGKGSTEMGQGIVDFEALFAAADLAGLEDYYIEQERYNMTPLEAMKYDYDFLMKADYVKW